MATAIAGGASASTDPDRIKRNKELNALRTGMTMENDFLDPRHVATNLIDSRMLASGNNDAERAVGRSNIKSGAAGDEQISDMDGHKLHNDTVTNAKISSVSGSKLTSASVPDDALETNYAARTYVDNNFSDIDHHHNEYLTQAEGDARYRQL